MCIHLCKHMCITALAQEPINLETRIKLSEVDNSLDRSVGRFCDVMGGHPRGGDKNPVSIGPNDWLESMEAITCYDVYHFLVNCYALLGIEKMLTMYWFTLYPNVNLAIVLNEPEIFNSYFLITKVCSALLKNSGKKNNCCKKSTSSM